MGYRLASWPNGAGRGAASRAGWTSSSAPARASPLCHAASGSRRTDAMAYVAVKGGGRAIGNAHAWLAEVRRGDAAVPELEVAQVTQQLGLAVDRVMAEGS